MDFIAISTLPNWVYYSIAGSSFLVYYYYNVVQNFKEKSMEAQWLEYTEKYEEFQYFHDAPKCRCYQNLRPNKPKLGNSLHHCYETHLLTPVLTCSSSKYKSFLEKCVPIVSEKYWPTIWCFESRVQTVLANFLQGDIQVPYERETLTLDDGGIVALDWLHTKNENSPVILILPGLTGCSSTTYIKKFAHNAQDGGFRSVVFNYRGLGGVDLTTPRTYCATNTKDLVEVVQHVKNKFPNSILGATGISMGALILGNYLIRHAHEEQQISAAMLVCTPFDVFKATENIEQVGLNLLLNKHLASNLKKTVERLKHVLDIEGKPWKMEDVLKSRTVREFDSKFTARQFGYESVEHYYQDATLIDKMEKIRIPVLCLSAADDPFQPLMHSSNDESGLFNHDKIAVLVTARGGHIAFLEGLWPFGKRSEYMHRVFSQYFSAMFAGNAYKDFIST